MDRGIIAGERLKCITIYREYLPEEEVLGHETDLALLEYWISMGDDQKAADAFNDLTDRMTEWRDRRANFINHVKGHKC